MPNIGGKKFPYTPAGRAAASRYSRATGQPMSNAGGYGGGNPGRGGYGMRSPMPTPRRGGYGMRSPMSVPRQGMRRPGMMAGLRRPMAPSRRSRMNPMAMLGMRNRRRNIV